MRVFTALYPPPAATSDVERVLAPLRGQHDELAWTRPEQWHLTLTFHAQLDDKRVGQLDRVVARCAAGRRSTRVRFRGGGAFPTRARGRLLWIGVEPVDEALADLQRNLVARLRRRGWDVEQRRFRPHLTVARSRERRDLRSVAAALDDYEGPLWDVDTIAVVVSRPGGDGRFHHERLGEHRLGGAA